MSDLVTQSVFLKPAEVARRLNISVPQVHRILRRGDMPCLRMGPGTVRIRDIDLKAYIERLVESSRQQ
jgi:excisionase family DNA binding protein